MKKKCEELISMIEDGIRWTESHVDRERGQSDVLARLKTQRRVARRLERAAALRPGIAVFGASQQGKSYLVSNMVHGRDGAPLEIEVPGTGRRVPFQADINPDGGRESTGTVTRFTVDERLPSGQNGVQIELLSQGEVVGILADAFLGNVLPDERAGSGVDRDALQNTFGRLRRGLTSGSAETGMTEDDVFDLRDYVNRIFASNVVAQDLNRMGFWEDAAAVAPRLAPTARWEVFQFLWAGNPLLTEIFNRLSEGLAKLGFRRFAATDIDAFVPKFDTRPRTIIDVNVVADIALEVETLPPVTLRTEDGKTVSLPRGVTTALVKEVIFHLPPEVTEDPSLRFLREGDVLDFPGARTSQMIHHTWVAKSHPECVTTVKELFVRGKVSFLFRSYDEQFRFTSLMICQADSNVNVKVTTFLAYNWIAKNIGASAAARVGRKPNFFMVFTFWNNELAKPANGPEANAAKWEARFSSNFIDEWKRSAADDNWIDAWTPNTPFKNSFVIRDPKYSKALFESAPNGTETDLRPEQRKAMADMRTSFLSSSVVGRCFNDPVRMWDESASANKTGMSTLLDQLNQSFSAEDRTQQIALQIQTVRGGVVAALEPHHRGDDQAKERQKAEAEARLAGAELWKLLKNGKFGVLLDRLYVSEETAWKAYYDVENPVLGDAEGDGNGTETAIDGSGVLVTEDPENIFDFDFGIPSEPVVEKAEKPRAVIWNKADVLADDLLDRWSRGLSDLCEDEGALRGLGAEREAVRALVKGLKDTARRVDIRSRVSERVRPGIDNSASGSRIDLYSKVAASTINGFINDFDWDRVAEAARPKVRLSKTEEPRPIFSTRGKAIPKRRELAMESNFPGFAFAAFWMQGLASAVIANVGGEPMSAAAVEANNRLGELLRRLGTL